MERSAKIVANSPPHDGVGARQNSAHSSDLRASQKMVRREGGAQGRIMGWRGGRNGQCHSLTIYQPSPVPNRLFEMAMPILRGGYETVRIPWSSAQQCLTP